MKPQPTNRAQEELKILFEHYRSGRLNNAEKLARSITRETPLNEVAWKALWAILQKIGKTKESLNAIQKAEQISPRDAKVCYSLGYTLLELERFSKAEASFRKVVALKPDNAEAHHYLGVTMQKLGKLDDAEASYKQAIALKPDYAKAHFNFGITLKKMGRLDDAEASYKRAIALKPDNAEYHYNLGAILQRMQRLDEAVASHKKAIALKPNYAEVHYNLGVTLKIMGRLDDAEASYNQAIALKPDLPEFHYDLGATLKRMGRLKGAEKSYKKAIALKPNFGIAKHSLAALTGETTKTAPQDYVEQLFDSYAAKFEIELIDNLDYRIPGVLAEIIIRDSKFDLLGSITDLGCGTGLFGLEIIKFCERLEGVDLSEKMLEKAKEKNVYNKLVKQDITEYLSTTNLNFDCFVATDVFNYIGDLSDVFRLVKSRNAKGGKLAFSTEHYDGKGFFLEQSGRYSHSKTYIDSLCKTFRYKIRHFETQNLRKAKNQYIKGGLYILDF